MRFACTIIIFVALLETTPIFAETRRIDPVEDFRGVWSVTYWTMTPLPGHRARMHRVSAGQYDAFRISGACHPDSHALKLPTRHELQVICQGI